MRKRARQTSSTDEGIEEEILGLLREHGLPPDQLQPTPEQKPVYDQRAAEALGRIVATPPKAKRSSTRWVRRHRLAFAVALITAAVIVGSTWIVLARSDRDLARPLVHPNPTPSSFPSLADGRTPGMAQFTLAAIDSLPLSGQDPKTALMQLAVAAASEPDPPSGEIQQITLAGWWFDSSVDTSLSDNALIPTVTRIYYRPDNSVRTITARGAPLDQQGRLVDTRALKISDDQSALGPEQGYAYAQELPRDPEALTSALIPSPDDCPSRAACLTAAVVQLHSGWVVPPSLEAVLWRALSREPDVTYLGDSTDRLGRPALALGVPGTRPEEQTILYADRQTGKLLAVEQILVRSEPGTKVTPPGVLAFTVFAHSSWSMSEDTQTSTR